MLIWINGTFGIGKTQTAHEVQRKIPGSVVADPELLGFGIQRMYPPTLRGDFQETPWWAPTTTAILADIADRHAGDVIVPMTLADPERWRGVIGALTESGLDVRHLTLLASRATVRTRLRTRWEGRNGWAMSSYSQVDSALRDPLFATHLETDDLGLPEVVTRIGESLGRDLRYSMSERLTLPARRLGVALRHVR